MVYLKVSAIVPVYNGEKFISDCVESLLKQDVKFDEIIAIDDGSTDNTVNLLKKQPIKLIENPHFGRSATRNAGLKIAKNEIVFFVEADAIYSSNFLSECLTLFSNPLVGGVIGKLEVRNRTASVWTKCRAAELDSRFEKYVPFTGWMYRKAILDKIGGFDESLDIGEDVYLGEKVQEAGYKIAYAPNARWLHLEPSSLNKIWKNSFLRGVELIKKYRKSFFPKTLFLDFFAFLFFLIGFWNNLFFLIPLCYILAQLVVRRKQFLHIEKKLWLHLIFYLISNIFLFKSGRFFGILRCTYASL